MTAAAKSSRPHRAATQTCAHMCMLFFAGLETGDQRVQVAQLCCLGALSFADHLARVRIVHLSKSDTADGGDHTLS